MSAAAYYYAFDSQELPALDSDQEWSMTVRAQPLALLNLRESCRLQALRLHEKAQRRQQPVMLHLSGGDDSMVMALSFVQQNLPIQAVTREYRIGNVVTNREDVDTAIEFCAKHGIDHSVDVYEDFDHTWSNTSHEHLRDMTVLGARLGALHYAGFFNVLGTAPFISSRGDEWSMMALFSVEGQYSHSFFNCPSIFWRLLTDPALETLVPALPVLNKQIKHYHAGVFSEVMVYETIAKACILHRAFPELKQFVRVKSTGFDNHLQDYPPTASNLRYLTVLRQKAFRVSLRTLLENRFQTQRYCFQNNELMKRVVPC